MRKVLAIDDKLATDEMLELSDDRPSCELFWGTILDFVNRDGAAELSFYPAHGDNCLTAVIEKQSHELVPVPVEVRQVLLHFAQRIALGWIPYTYLVQWRKKPFTRERRDPLLVEVGDRRSLWRIQSTLESVRFLRVS